MKQKISITVEENIITKIDDEVKKGIFRNKSHFIEFAINKFLVEENKNVIG